MMSLFRKSAETLDRSLLAAIKDNELAKFEKLLALGAHASMPGEGGALYLAIKFQREKMTEILLEHGANPNERIGRDSTLLLMALDGWRGIAMQMLTHGADPNLHAFNGQRPLSKAFEKYRTDEILKMIEKGLDVSTPDGGLLPLHQAVITGNTRIAQKMIERGVDINATDAEGRTALHHAAARGDAYQVIMLMERGADETLVDNEFRPPASHADKNHPGLAAILRGQRPGQPLPKPESGWVLVADDEVARVTVKAAIAYRVTEVFNFTSRIYSQISRNLDTGAESSAVKAFSSVAEGGLVAAAQEALERLGGHAPTAAKRKLPGIASGMGA